MRPVEIETTPHTQSFAQIVRSAMSPGSRTWPGIWTLILAVLLLAVSLPTVGAAQEDATNESTTAPAVKQIRAGKINPHAPKIDGVLNDEIWQKADFISDFTQKQPNEGEPSGERTEVAFMYDGDALYIGARVFSKNPDKIVSTMARRDNAGNSERIVISLDTYNNNRTAYSFGVTASGVRVDYYHASDNEYNRRYDFDPVWKAKTKRTATGWEAEMRIPFTQLRFNNTREQVWGVNINRWTPNLNEDAYWVMVPQSENGWSSRMGDLVGIEDIRPSRRVEVMPYVSGSGTYSDDVDADNPFRDGDDYTSNFGGDLKMGVGPNLTLDATINPDFGQVDMDPAFVNLSQFEQVFDERRPFFLEGNELLSGGGADYYFSRRIGRAPRGSLDTDELGFDPDYVDRPINSTILGAAKLTGRLKSGLNVGILGAVTEEEKARAYNSETDQIVEGTIEPAAGFGVIRLQQEFGSNGSTIGMIATGNHNDLKPGTYLNTQLRRNAYSGGIDWNLRFKGGRYEVGGNVGASYIEGSNSSIANAQESSARYFQRPDADYVNFDPTRTSLQGYVARLRVEKESGEHWTWGTGVGAESPEFEINDMGLIRQVDDLYWWGNMRYTERNPGKLFHRWSVNTWANAEYNFGGVRNWSNWGINFNPTYKNFMESWIGVNFWPANMSDNLTRGGPLMQMGQGMAAWTGMNSSQQGNISWWWNLEGWGNELGAIGGFVGGNITWRAGGRMELSFGPRYNLSRDARQYTDRIEGGNLLTYGDRYVFSFADRSTLSAEIRMNLAITPDLTLEFWGQPFASSGKFYDFGELEAAQSQDLTTYGVDDGTTIELLPEDDDTDSGTYLVTDGPDQFTFNRPDFNTVSFRSNLVLRWEWNPGSTLFIVWQQSRDDSYFDNGVAGQRVTGQSWVDALRAGGDNVFAIKLTYWIPLM